MASTGLDNKVGKGAGCQKGSALNPSVGFGSGVAQEVRDNSFIIGSNPAAGHPGGMKLALSLWHLKHGLHWTG